jgi:L-threonylcarbamoyladenylate synthase
VSPTRAADVVVEVGRELDPRTDLVVDGGPCRIGVESTIVDCTTPHPRVLRLGAISQQQIDEVLTGTPGPLDAAPPAAPGMPAPAAVRAPGTLESHYSPRARVVLVEAGDPLVAGPRTADSAGPAPKAPSTGAGAVGLVAEAGVPTPPGWTRLLAADSAPEFARGLYRALRRADDLGLEVVVAVPPDPRGGALAAAVRDRLARAAHGS